MQALAKANQRTAELETAVSEATAKAASAEASAAAANAAAAAKAVSTRLRLKYPHVFEDDEMRHRLRHHHRPHSTLPPSLDPKQSTVSFAAAYLVYCTGGMCALHVCRFCPVRAEGDTAEGACPGLRGR